jgi:hypothetical protein
LKGSKKFEEIRNAILYAKSKEENIKYHLFDAKEIHALLTKSGFKIVEMIADSIIIQTFGSNAFDLFSRGNEKMLKLVEKVDNKLISCGLPDLAEHLIVVAKKV